jgi:hypothetical protein
LVVDLTGAEPTLFGGGELGLDNEADVIEALSEIISLTGVLGRSSLVIEAILGWRESTLTALPPNTCIGIVTSTGGDSVFGVGTSRRVFGAGLLGGFCADIEVVLVEGNGGKADVDAAVFTGVLGPLAVSVLDNCAGTAILSMTPGVCFFPAVFTPAGLTVGVTIDFFDRVIERGPEGVVGTSFPFPFSSIGKSSACNTEGGAP